MKNTAVKHIELKNFTFDEYTEFCIRIKSTVDMRKVFITILGKKIKLLQN